MKFDDLLTGLIRLHILHHAAEMEIYGQWMIDELGHHGYPLGPGSPYPMLHVIERKGYLVSSVERQAAPREGSIGPPSSAETGLHWQRYAFADLPARP
jgi:PadR family transcriptional regulator, regulatory protein PadR